MNIETRLRSIVPLLALLFATASCNEKLTEMLVVVSNAGLVIGDEVDAIDITLRGPDGVVGHQQRVALCGTGSVASAQCLYFPFSVLLVPGEMKPTAPVEVEIDAIKGGKKVIANVAIFRFTKRKTLRLDVVLYPDCIDNLSCAEQKKACAQNGMCTDITPTELDPNEIPKQPDLAGVTADLSGIDQSVMGEDMSLPRDFSTVPDLIQPDFFGCIGSCVNRACGDNGCGTKCGECLGQTFCQDPGAPLTSACLPCGQSTQQCCPGTHPLGPCTTGLSCQSGICAPQLDMSLPTDLLPPTDFLPPTDLLNCGQINQLCCAGQLCFTGSCNGTLCVPNDMFTPADMSIITLPDGGIRL